MRSRRAPISTPWNGSSSSSQRQGAACQRPITTFCWLPPDNDSSESRGPPAANAQRLDGADRGAAFAPRSHETAREPGFAMRQRYRARDVAGGRRRGQQRSRPAILARQERRRSRSTLRGFAVARERHPARLRPRSSAPGRRACRRNRLFPAPSAPTTATISPAWSVRSKGALSLVTQSVDRGEGAGRLAAPRRRGHGGRDRARSSGGCRAGDRTGGPARPRPSVAQHDQTIRDPLDIAHAVRDVEYADAARAQPIDHAEQDGGFARRKARGRFVEQQQRRVSRDGARDRHEWRRAGPSVAKSAAERVRARSRRRLRQRAPGRARDARATRGRRRTIGRG